MPVCEVVLILWLSLTGTPSWLIEDVTPDACRSHLSVFYAPAEQRLYILGEDPRGQEFSRYLELGDRRSYLGTWYATWRQDRIDQPDEITFVRAHNDRT